MGLDEFLDRLMRKLQLEVEESEKRVKELHKIIEARRMLQLDPVQRVPATESYDQVAKWISELGIHGAMQTTFTVLIHSIKAARYGA